MEGIVALRDDKNVQQIACPQCETTFKVGPDRLKAGSNYKCSQCGTVFPLKADEIEPAEQTAGWKIRLRKTSKEIQVGSIDKLKRLIIEGKIGSDDELVWKDGRAKPLSEIERFAPFFRVRQLSNDLKAVGHDDPGQDASPKPQTDSETDEPKENDDSPSSLETDDISVDTDLSSSDDNPPERSEDDPGSKPAEEEPEDESEPLTATDASEAAEHPAEKAPTEKPAETSTEVQRSSQMWPVVIMLSVLAAIAVAIFLATRS